MNGSGIPAELFRMQDRNYAAMQDKETSAMHTLERAKELNAAMITEDHLIVHALNVCYAMGAMAEHFGEEVDHWQAIGMLGTEPAEEECEHAQ